MRNVHRRVPIVAGILAAAGAWGISAVGCSSNGGSTGGGPDATADAEGDGQGDVSQVDTSTGTDSQADTFVADSFVAADTSNGADADAAAPDGDAGAADVYDATAALEYPGQAAAAWCNEIASCCGTSGDASTFNMALCLGNNPYGWKAAAYNGASLLSTGNVVFNASAAAACLSAIAVDCSTNQVSSAVEAQRYANCWSVYSGTLAAGSPCTASVECAPGNFCMPVDGGAGDSGLPGVCQALVGNGGACGEFGANLASYMCSYLGSGNTGLGCREWVTGSPNTPLDAGAWTCVPQLPLNAQCNINLDCTSFLCPGNDLCSSSAAATSASSCAGYFVDGG